MDTTEKLINNRGPRFIILFYLVIVLLSFVVSVLISSSVSKKAFENQTNALLMLASGNMDVTQIPSESQIKAGEEIFSEYGISSDMDVRLYENYKEFHKEVFLIIFFLLFFIATVWCIVSVFMLMKEYTKMEQMRQKCICISEERKYDEAYNDYEFGTSLRLWNSINDLGEKMEYCTQKLTTEKEYIRDFLYDFSHQIKTSVSVLRLNSDILASVENINEEKKNELYEEIISHIDDVENLVLSALKLAKMNTGVMTYNMAQNNVCDICKRAIRKISPIMGKIKISFNCSLEEIIYECDKTWLCEAIENIIKNSVDHAECTAIDVMAEETVNAVIITISDNGKGIEQSKIPGMFERFGYKNENNGMNSIGIGVSIASKIVNAHNGEIIVKSALGKGTQFQFVMLRY